MSTAAPSILIVDDEPANLRLLLTMLDEHGYDVRFATGGRTALASVRAEVPDLILLDIEMPDLSGYEVCRRLKQDPKLEAIPVLFVSAAQDAEAKVRSFQVGGVDYVSKPFQVDEVMARIRHQLTIHRQRAQIETQAARLRELDAVKSRSFAGVSHELRTPLMLTRGLVQDVIEGRHGPLPVAARDELERAQLHADRLEELIEQILDLSRLEVGAVRLDRQTIDLADLLGRLRRAFVPLAERAGVALVLEAPKRLTVAADAEALTKVVTNLLANACRHTPVGGRVTLRLESDSEAVRLRVEDTGCGIPPDVLPHVFERFYRHEGPSQRDPGAGLGLSLAHELVVLHGGTLTAESTVGRGSTFTVTLPRTADDASAKGERCGLAPVVRLRGAEAALLAAEPAPDPEPDGEDRTTVLVVDDNAEVRRYLRSHLAGRYRILEAADGHRALCLAREALPDLVVSDVQMPQLDGLTLCRTLKQDPRTDFIPVLLLTVRVEARLDGLAAGADDYLAKPFDVAELTARVDNLVARQRSLRARLDEAPHPHSFELLAIRRPDLEPDEVAFLRRLEAAIEEHLNDPDFSVTDLASALAQDRTTLYRWLQRLLGESPSDVLRNARLQRAASLLARRAGTVSEIAYAVGFRSVQHFDRCFRAAYDATPTDYVEQQAAA